MKKMPLMKEHFMLVGILIFCTIEDARSLDGHYTLPNVTHLTDLFHHQTLNQAFLTSFGSSNIHFGNNGSNVQLTLNKTSGSGLISLNKYNYGFFSSAIKLPPGYSSGVVVAFYMSNADLFPHNHDEIDFEFLGHENGKQWILQTNIYGNGKTNIGREEKFRLWFDPTEEFHQYSIIWNSHHIVFLVDNIPVREVENIGVMSAVYPSKPMSVYATIWDGSEWATNGGKNPVNYKYEPFVASFGEMEMEGCVWISARSVPSCSKGGQEGPSTVDPVEGEDFVKLSQQQKMGMDWARNKFMIYSYCKDPGRFPVLPPECRMR
ncbi:probable xyloglucan endotransglucosylase/hydrolase protein 33 [Telopea speciosissima]|uniref:probable xyloglucan endotransglucosylase/hydrolase protein 33 n=1 Tax=Telopea speciosissima TaxID=54955 RepID=UPI001CC40469|nr:probable xyloglucan endotransglucosylase/hydrolase protein 33 [Telopea speciosissima]